MSCWLSGGGVVVEVFDRFDETTSHSLSPSGSRCRIFGIGSPSPVSHVGMMPKS